MRNFDDRVENSGATAAGRLSADEDNVRFKEMENLAGQGGISLDPQAGPDTDLYMMSRAVSRMSSAATYGACSGSANTYVIAGLADYTLPTALFTGMMIRTTINVSNTGATTANVFGIGSKKVLRVDGSELSSGDLLANTPTVWVYDATADSSAGAWLVMPWAIGDISSLPEEVANLKTPPRFIGTSSGQTIPPNTWADLSNFNVSTRFRDPGSSFVNGVLTTVGADAGDWIFIATFSGPGAAHAVVEMRKVNRIAWASTYSAAAGIPAVLSIPGQRPMGDGETLRMGVYHTSATNHNTNELSQFAGWRIGD
ncbi:MAG: hypothetical protein RIC14_05720 [Filomicrobium sp.]